MNPTPPKPSRAELLLLQALWELGPATAKQVHEAAQRSKPELSYATVLRQLQLMHSKGLLQREESARAHVYSCAQEPHTQQNNLLQDMIQRVFAGSTKALVLSALRNPLSAKDKAEIRALLEKKEKDE